MGMMLHPNYIFSNYLNYLFIYLLINCLLINDALKIDYKMDRFRSKLIDNIQSIQSEDHLSTGKFLICFFFFFNFSFKF